MEKDPINPSCGDGTPHGTLRPLRVHVPAHYAHPKNKAGFELMMVHAQKIGAWVPWADGATADVVWSPSEPAFFPSARKVLYGPHFSVFPDHKFLLLPADPRFCYVQPSDWCVNVWRECRPGAHVPLHAAPFPVDVKRFSPGEGGDAVQRTECFVYAKQRPEREVREAVNLLRARGYDPHVLNYKAGYQESDYIDLLRRSAFGVWVGCHESQGFALEEALAMDVPLLVWSVTHMSQEVGSELQYAHIRTRATTVPYWDDRCGVVVTESFELAQGLDMLIAGVQAGALRPRAFVVENLSPAVVYERYWAPLIGHIQ